MSEEKLAQASYEKLVERCKLLGSPVPAFAVAKQALRGQRWTPREAQELRQLIDAATL